jgi:hypothetical protein
MVAPIGLLKGYIRDIGTTNFAPLDTRQQNTLPELVVSMHISLKQLKTFIRLLDSNLFLPILSANDTRYS